MKAQAAIAYKGEAGFRFEEIEVEGPREEEILVRIEGVGLCHTDLVFASGAMEDYPFPAVLGHEGSGEVVSVGAKVSKVAPGDKVLITFRSCGACDRCDAGDAAYCRTMPLLNYTGRREDGSAAYQKDGGELSSNFFGQSSFSTLAITYERNVVKVDPSLPVEIMGPLGCGIQTGAGAVMRSLNARRGSSILITGGGSVGLSAVMAAKIRECAQIILVEPMAERRKLAEDFGATHTIAPEEGKCFSEAVREIVPLGVDNAFDTSGVPAVQASALASLGSKATLGLVGISPPGTPLPGEVNNVMTFGQSIRGIIEGDSDPDEFLPELIGYYKAGKLPFDKLVKTYPLSQINQAIHDQHAGTCVKVVLIPDKN